MSTHKDAHALRVVSFTDESRRCFLCALGIAFLFRRTGGMIFFNIGAILLEPNVFDVVLPTIIVFIHTSGKAISVRGWVSSL